MTPPTPAPEPTAYLATALTPRACDAYGLVLQAIGLSYSVRFDGVGYGFWVQPEELGRATLYGLAAGGEAGVGHALDILSSEADRVLGQLGCRSLADLTAQMLRPGVPTVPGPVQL